MLKKNSHCSYCGTLFNEKQPWPRRCASCGQISYLNPLPVSVVLVPIDDGLLLIRRSVEPKKGMLALPGGYINLGESWQEAGARELFEETGTTIAPGELQVFNILSAPDGTLLVFGLARPRAAANLPAFVASDETTESVVITTPQELAFSTHTQVVKEFFSDKGKR